MAARNTNEKMINYYHKKISKYLNSSSKNPLLRSYIQRKYKRFKKLKIFRLVEFNFNKK